MSGLLNKSLRYATMPGIIPRLKGFSLNFGYIAYLMALVFNVVRLLPREHPYLLPINMNRYSVRQVLAAAAHNLKGGVRNIDQYIIFGGFLLGVTLLVVQFVLIFLFIAIHSAEAAAPLTGFGSMFDIDPARAQTDVAFMMLDMVFQIPGLFNSSLAPATYASSTFFAKGLHMLFAFYSRGMLMIAGLIIIYYFFVIVVESAQTGVPFGERFDTVYAPIRLVLAIMLLLPLHYGLNSGQYLTLHLAKWGSNFATNAWNALNNVTGHNPMGLTTREMVVTPRTENIHSIVNFYQLVHACRAAYYYLYYAHGSTTDPKVIQAYFVRQAHGTTPAQAEIMDNRPFADIRTFFDGGTIKIVYGEQHADFEEDYPAGVKPYCGILTLQVDSQNIEGINDLYMTYYEDIMYEPWVDEDLNDYGNRTALIYFKERGPANGACDASVEPPDTAWDADCAMNAGVCQCDPAGPEFHRVQKTFFQAIYESDNETVVDNIRNTTLNHLAITQPMLDLGWGGAGVWFNRLAEYNGALVSATIKIPQPVAYPAVMEFVAKQKMKNQSDSKATEMFTPNVKEGETIDQFWDNAKLDDPAVDMSIAKFLDDTYQELNGTDNVQDMSQRVTKNAALDTINSIFGVAGLFALKENTDVNPMSRLAAMGRGIIDKSIMFLGGALIMSGVGGFIGVFDQGMGRGFSLASGVVSMFGMSGLTVGFVFFYLVPMMPFMYFFFAVGRWVKTIFEAMVGIPLWALAHIRIDGEGIPGQAAANGYFLLLEIMLRPILTVFGLLIAFSSFNAMVAVLDGIFNVVVANVAGYDPFAAGTGAVDTDFLAVARSGLDEFFYTIIYCIMVYMIATSSFKLIDLIPNGVLRFAGSSVPSFGDKAGDPMENLVQYTAVASHTVTDDLSNAVTGLGRGAGSTLGNAMKSMMGQGKSPAADASKQMRQDMAARMRGSGNNGGGGE